MKTTLFIPQKIKVGYQHRSDTFTNKLGIVTYFDEKGILKQEKSFDNWRDLTISADEFDNTPIEYFAIEKNVGGVEHSYGRYARKTKFRVYDPRGFEVEIDSANLIWILSSTDYLADTGFVGKFVYAWDGANMILLSVNAPEYKEIQKYTTQIQTSDYVNPSDFIIGHIYKDKKGNELVYLGRFDYWDYTRPSLYAMDEGYKWKSSKKHHFADFYDLQNLVKARTCYLVTYANIKEKFLADVGAVDMKDIEAFMKAYERNYHFSPGSKTLTERAAFTFEEFEKVCAIIPKDNFEIHSYDNHTYLLTRTESSLYELHLYASSTVWSPCTNTTNGTRLFTLKEIFDKIRPHYNRELLKNGKLHDVDLLKYGNFGLSFEELLPIFEK